MGPHRTTGAPHPDAETEPSENGGGPASGADQSFGGETTRGVKSCIPTRACRREYAK